MEGTFQVFHHALLLAAQALEQDRTTMVCQSPTSGWSPRRQWGSRRPLRHAPVRDGMRAGLTCSARSAHGTSRSSRIAGQAARFRIFIHYGLVMALLSSATRVCASALPFMLAPVCKVMAVLARMIPSEVRGRTEGRVAGDLPDDVLRLRAAAEHHVLGRVDGEITAGLEDPGVVGAASDGHVGRNGHGAGP